MQRRRIDASAFVPTPSSLKRAAAIGLGGAGGPLPHLETIQRSFGRHDLSRVEAHVDAAAAEGAAAMSAHAFASGDRVAFARAPSLRLAAHEAAHVVQQRAGVRPDARAAHDPHERHADAVADAVVHQRSSEALLDRYAAAPSPSSAPAPVQRAQVDVPQALRAQLKRAAINTKELTTARLQ